LSACEFPCEPVPAPAPVGPRPFPVRRLGDLDALNGALADASAPDLVIWAHDTFGDGLVMSTSFGIHSAVLLHMATAVRPDVPVVWVDTGYLPAETYRFAESLCERLDLNLVVAQSSVSPARMEALHGRLFERDDRASLDLYDRIRKVEPMRRVLEELGARAWLSGIRASQTEHRASLRPVERQNGIWKVSPLLDWSARDLHRYLVEHDLPYHPYFDLGYATVGDAHSSRPVAPGDEHERDTRFRGLKQECGLHLELDPGQFASLDSSGL
jgi:phosphoadenosine phosphosulfate reductase